MNTGGEMPFIDDGSSGKEPSRGTAGIVAVYESGPYDRETVDSPGRFKDHHNRVTMKVYTRDRVKMNSLLGEIERIYNNVKNNPEGGPGPAQHWDWIKDLGETPQKDYPGVADTFTSWEYIAHSIAEAT